MIIHPAQRGWLPDALPPLSGLARWAFIAIWSASLAICLASAVLSLPAFYHRLAAPISGRATVGIALNGESGRILGAMVDPEAERLGLHRGDELLTIDGLPAAIDPTILDQQLDGPVGGRVTITTRSPAGVVSRHGLMRDPDLYTRALAGVGLTPLSASLMGSGLDWVLTFLVVFACAVVLMARRARDPLAPWASLAMLWVSMTDGNASSWLTAHFSHPSVALYFLQAIANASLIIILAFFPNGRFKPRWSIAVALIAAASVPAGVWSDLGSNILFLLGQVGAVAAIVVRYRGMPPGTGRQQIRWALLGFGSSIVMMALWNVVHYSHESSTDIGVDRWLTIGEEVISSLATVALAVGMTVSLLRYRLYDADATISRSIIYGALTLSLLAIFAGSEKVIEIMGEEYFGERLGALAGGLGAAVAAVCIGPLHHRVTHWAEHRFRSGLAHLRNGLPLLVADMRETATPAALADAMLARVEKGVRARHGAVVVADRVLDARDVDEAAVNAWLGHRAAPAEGSRRLHADRTDPLFPLRVPLHADGVGLVGWLLLGPRPDGSFYGREERAALHEIAEPVARALAIAIEREQRDAVRRQELADMWNAIGQLRESMAGRQPAIP